MFIRYRYNASGMCENPGSVLLTTSYTKNVNLKLTKFNMSIKIKNHKYKG